MHVRKIHCPGDGRIAIEWPGASESFVNQDVAPAASLGNRIGRRSIAGDYDGLSRTFKSVAVGLPPVRPELVVDEKCRYADIRVLIHHAGLDCVRLNLVAIFIALRSH